MPTNPKEYYPPMHTAEHILNQTMVRMFKTERSFSNHIERKKSKCDYHFDRNISDVERENLQAEVNRIISSNMDVCEAILTIDEAKSKISLDRMPKSFGDEIRIITIGDYDLCPCSGVHVKNTTEIGNVKIISSSFDNNILRVRFKLQN